MTARDFCYWLQGVFEVGRVTKLDEHQTDLVKRHLALVFKHEIDPAAGPPEVQAELDKIHQGAKPSEPWQSTGGGQHPGIIARC